MHFTVTTYWQTAATINKTFTEINSIDLNRVVDYCS